MTRVTRALGLWPATALVIGHTIQALAGITVVLCGLPAYRFLSPAAGPAPAAAEVER